MDKEVKMLFEGNKKRQLFTEVQTEVLVAEDLLGAGPSASTKSTLLSFCLPESLQE